MTEYARRRDFMFCQMCGSMLDFSSTTHAKCPLCHWKLRSKYFAEKEISYTVTAEDIRRELNIEQFVNPDGIYDEELAVAELPTIEHKCQCGHGWATYESRQMRSADEGETKIYKCLKCGVKVQEN